MAAPSATPRAKPPSNLGCVVAILALPVVIVLGLVLGTALRGDDEPEEEHVTLASGGADEVEWKVDAVRDVDGQSCIFLYEDDAEDPLNGTCDLEPQDVSYPNGTVVFGRVDSGDSTVTVELTGDDEEVEVDTVTADGVDGRFYVTVVEGDVDAVRLVD